MWVVSMTITSINTMSLTDNSLQRRKKESLSVEWMMTKNTLWLQMPLNVRTMMSTLTTCKVVWVVSRCHSDTWQFNRWMNQFWCHRFNQIQCQLFLFCVSSIIDFDCPNIAVFTLFHFPHRIRFFGCEQ